MQKNIFFKIIFACLFLPVSVFAIQTHETVENHKPFVSFDVSGSGGNYNGKSYTELHLGMNLNFTDWLTWRNSAFKRVTSGSTADTTGLDSSLLLNYSVSPVNFYAGPGYRFASDSDQNALFAQAGASIKVSVLTVGAGLQYIRYDKTQIDPVAGTQTKQDDTSYFLTFSGGTGWAF
ncbi:MAG: hypothetical protein ACXVAX_08265 [Pseudobdellovibrio sp.]